MKPIQPHCTVKEIVPLLKKSKPFQKLPNSLLTTIAKIVRCVSYEKGESIYKIGDKADDIYIVISGKVEQVFDSTAKVTTFVKKLGSGDFFGWAGLFKDQPHGTAKRVAVTTCKAKTDVMVINCKQLIRILKADRASYDAMMQRFVDLIINEFSVQGSWLGFVDVDGKLVPSHISSLSGEDTTEHVVYFPY